VECKRREWRGMHEGMMGLVDVLVEKSVVQESMHPINDEVGKQQEQNR